MSGPTAPKPSPIETTEPGSRAHLVSTQLLLDLVTNTLDPGYAAAAARRGDAPRRRWWDRPLVALGCLLIGFTAVVAYVHTHRGAPEAAKVHNSLVARVNSAQAQAEQLTQQVQRLDQQVTAARNQALPGSAGSASALSREEVLAGQTAVQGPGVQVTLTNPKGGATSIPARVGTVGIAATNILTDRDLQSVVNELWADGAEAIAVNDVRLTPTSAIRFAGEAVLVDFVPIASPYVVQALGAADALDTSFAASAVASRYQTLISADGIGFSFGEHTNLTLPAAAPTTLRYAHPAATAGR